MIEAAISQIQRLAKRINDIESLIDQIVTWHHLNDWKGMTQSPFEKYLRFNL